MTIICPQCQSENIDQNNFCIYCGTSLINTKCYNCQSQIKFSDAKCSNCGTITGTIWHAIVKPMSVIANVGSTTQSSGSKTFIQVVHPQKVTSDSDTVPDLNAINIHNHEYLGNSARYQLLYPLTSTNYDLLETKVLDLKPLQVPPKQENIPEFAKIYDQLGTELESIIPKIHDSWITENKEEVILIEDRERWELFIDFCGGNKADITLILYSLGRTLKLWEILANYQCCQSLLEIENLLLDQDQTLCLKKIYPDPINTNLSLKDLGEIWYRLLKESQATQLGELAQLVQKLRQEDITTIEQVKASLSEIFNQLQPQQPEEPSLEDTEDIEAEDIETTAADENDDSSNMNPDILSSPTIPFSAPNQGRISSDDEDDEDNSPTVILPMQLMSLDDAGITDIGRMRNHNEDYFAIETEHKKRENATGRILEAKGLYVICDGMGGHAGGEVASVMAVETIRRYFQEHWHDDLPREDIIRDGVLLANQKIYEVNQQSLRSGSGRMGTTLIMALIQGTKVAIASVGDSRIYRFTRKYGLEQLTTDHEVGQREIQRGVDAAIAYARPDAYQLTQALGPRDENFVNPDIKFLEMNEETLLLLCSDGLSDNDLVEEYYQNYLVPLLSSRANLEQGLQQLIDLANQRNGHDNITAIVIRAKVRPNMDISQK
ncbi:MAG TPA: serine/threonine phosphatase [Allocoleopsis sp.]